MPINVTVRDIINFPGGTPKTITLDIAQIIPSGGTPEGDEIWVSSATTNATASGGGNIQNIFKNEMKRGWIRSSGLISGNIDVQPNQGLKVAVDEAAGNGVDITLTSGNGLLPSDIAQDLEDKIRQAGEINQGGAKAGNLSYLNAQVRFTDNKFQIESGTVTDRFTGDGRSSVAVTDPDAPLSSAVSSLGFDISLSSEDLASRQLVETQLTSDYTSGDTLELGTTAGLDAGSAFLVTDGTNSATALVSGTETGSVLRFTAVSGAGEGLSNSFSSGALVRKLQEVDVKEPVSAVKTVDSLYRFSIDSIVNQIDFSA